MHALIRADITTHDTHTYVHTYIHTTYMHTAYIHTDRHTYMHTAHIHTYIHAYIHSHRQTSVHECLCIYVHAHSHIKWIMLDLHFPLPMQASLMLPRASRLKKMRKNYEYAVSTSNNMCTMCHRCQPEKQHLRDTPSPAALHRLPSTVCSGGSSGFPKICNVVGLLRMHQR